MSLNGVNAILEIDEKFGINIETPFDDFGDLLLTVLYRIRQKDSQQSTLSDSDFDLMNSVDFATPIREMIAVSINKPADTILPTSNLSDLFPRPGRSFSWRRLRKIGADKKWKVPPLKQNSTLDYLCRLGFYPCLYSGIALFVFGGFLFLGLSRPLGAYSIYVYISCMLIIAAYVLFACVASGIESLFGLYQFPDNMTTVGQLEQVLKNDNFLLWSSELNIKSQLENSLSESQQQISEQLKEIIARNFDMDADHIQFDTQLK